MQVRVMPGRMPAGRVGWDNKIADQVDEANMTLVEIAWGGDIGTSAGEAAENKKAACQNLDLASQNLTSLCAKIDAHSGAPGSGVGVPGFSLATAASAKVDLKKRYDAAKAEKNRFFPVEEEEEEED